MQSQVEDVLDLRCCHFVCCADRWITQSSRTLSIPTATLSTTTDRTKPPRKCQPALRYTWLSLVTLRNLSGSETWWSGCYGQRPRQQTQAWQLIYSYFVPFWEPWWCLWNAFMSQDDVALMMQWLTLLFRHFFWLWQKWVYQIVQCLTHHLFNFWHSGTLALRTERQSARMSKVF